MSGVQRHVRAAQIHLLQQRPQRTLVRRFLQKLSGLSGPRRRA